MAVTASRSTRSIHVEHRDGTASIVREIPATAKITFGPVSPGNRGYAGENVLRIYTSTSNQLAVFRDVTSFRDLSLQVLVEEIEVDTERHEKNGPDSAESTASSRSQRRFVPARASFAE